MAQGENGGGRRRLLPARKDYPRTADRFGEPVNTAPTTRRWPHRLRRSRITRESCRPSLAIVEKIKAPITYVLGGASTIVPPETQAQLKRTLPQVEIVTMPGLGHYPSEESPGEFLAIVDRFLSK